MTHQQNHQEPVADGKPAIAQLELQPEASAESGHNPPAKPGGEPEDKAKPSRRRRPPKNDTVRVIERWLNGLVLLFALACGLANHYQDRLPQPQEMVPELAQAPLQTPLEDEPLFQFSYRKHVYEVKTLAGYELWGIIASHNNISGLQDIYHSADSLDTKDICVLWGGNVAKDDYLKARFSSGAWTCYTEFPQGVSLNPEEISNNHLITNSDSLRRTIAGLRRGDQVHMRGRLVGYHDVQSPDFWRNSSLVRNDTGNGACEVVFVEAMEVLKTGNPFWRKLYIFAGIAALVLLAIRSLFLMVELFKPADERLSAFTWKK